MLNPKRRRRYVWLAVGMIVAIYLLMITAGWAMSYR